MDGAGMASGYLSDEEVFGASPRALSDDEVFGAPAPRADPKIGHVEELSMPERIAEWVSDKVSGKQGSLAATKGGKVGGFLRGAADPAVAGAQLVANALPGGAGAAVNRFVSDQEKQYQDARAIEGRDGFDALRAAGSYVATAPLAGVGAGMKAGTVAGAVSGLLNPVADTKDGYWSEKGKDVAIGAVGGAVMSPLLGALARVVSPKASTDTGLKMLRDEGVKPSIGQTLGGWANTLEQQATSLPIMGPAIGAARRRGIESFDEAWLNRAVAPVGGKVSQAGHEGVKEAGDMLSAAYNKAADDVGHVNLIGTTFDKNFGELREMASQGLSPELAGRFERVLENTVLRRLSPNGSIAGAEIKKVDSELGKIASKWGASPDPSHQEFSDAIRQLQQNFRDGLGEGDPIYKAAKDAADLGWRSLVPARRAAGAAANNEGVFTPAQIMAAIKGGDKSVGKRATAEGRAHGQDLARAGQRLGTKVADSGTAGRLGNIAVGIAAGGAHVGIPIALGAGAAAYHPAVQNVLRELIARRPDAAPRVANYLRELSMPAALAAGPLAAGLLER